MSSSSLTRKEKLDRIRQACLADLSTYIKTVASHRVLGQIHEELISWWQRQEAKDNQLVLLPRAHQKSVMIAYRVAHALAKNPAHEILYVSATSALAEVQLGLIKSILESPIHQKLWPELIHPDQGKRTKWTESEIIVDHPIRKVSGARDPSVKAAGLTTNITGFHADIVVLDDVVVPDNAYTLDGRNKVSKLYSQLASIEVPGCKEWVVGTRYHPTDLYSRLLDMRESIFDAQGEIVKEVNTYEVMQRVVEIDGDFLWPRSRGKDGKYYGFDPTVLSRIKAKYLDKSQFFAQYYNDPSDPESNAVDPDKFVYYDKTYLKYYNNWEYKGKKLNVFAGMDFAFSQREGADWTAIVVIGMDHDGYIFVLDIDRFKTDKISEYFNHLFALYNKWQFKKVRLEVTIAQQAIVKDLQDSYIRPNGLPLSIDEYRPSRSDGTKEERMAATLHPRYENGTILHYRGGNCELLENELIPSKPEHDDIKDGLTAAIDIAKPPIKITNKRKQDNVVTHPRFGGVAWA